MRVDKAESRFLEGLANYFSFELFSPHIYDMDTSNNSSIVLRLAGKRYVVHGEFSRDAAASSRLLAGFIVILGLALPPLIWVAAVLTLSGLGPGGWFGVLLERPAPGLRLRAARRVTQS